RRGHGADAGATGEDEVEQGVPGFDVGGIGNESPEGPTVGGRERSSHGSPVIRGMMAAAIMLFGVGQACAEEAWVRVRSPHFEVISDAARESARGVAVHLERFRRVLLAVLGRGDVSPDPTTVVIVFRDHDSFAPYLPLYRGRAVDVEGY